LRTRLLSRSFVRPDLGGGRWRLLGRGVAGSARAPTRSQARAEESSKATSGVLFERLEHQARRLQRMVLALPVTVAVVPACIFFVLEVNHLRYHAEHDAHHIVAVLTAEVARSGSGLQGVRERLRMEMAANELAVVRLMAAIGW
jgi:hypothetical protein